MKKLLAAGLTMQVICTGCTMMDRSFNVAAGSGMAGEAMVVKVTADRADGRYDNGEPATFTIDVTRSEKRIARGDVEVWIAQDGGPDGIAVHRFDLAEGNPFQVVGSCGEPCFLLCQVWVSAEDAAAYGERMVWYRKPASTERVTIEIEPDRSNHLYRCGEQVVFTARVTQEGEGIQRGTLALSLTRENRGDPLAEETFDLSDTGPCRISGTLSDASFLYCRAGWTPPGGEAESARAQSSVGFDVDKITAQAEMPADFENFWRETLAQARELPMDADLEKLEAVSNSRATYYRFSIRTLKDERVYGFLGIPRGEGPFPVLACYPGAGPGWGKPIDLGMTSRGVITVMLNVHKYPVPDDPQEARRKINEYWEQRTVEEETRETFYYYTTLAGFCRALDYVCTRDGWWDGEHLVLMGGSQGGFLSLAMSRLYSDRVTSAQASVPAFCDYPRNHEDADAEHLKRAAYYDTANFARSIRCPFQVSVGFVDNSCPPANVFSTYNALASRKKYIRMAVTEAHGTTPARQTMERASIATGLGLQ